ncbi:hypothetical protein [Mesorhizobium sp. ZC-5]|uniref:hypothetical protein n=1 Tax=Mesorhizobium sp. ZC-5 TaxID=2986066 RepID=UPI0021E85473|nr:hypothetical protein [Mesorhizobium sp. ZC-5]MCV3239675.1 hypothetical protein [Mesorhizobium sp. ZC-5]
MTDKSKVRIGKMHDVGGVIDEMKRVYREMRRGSLDTLEGKRLVDALTSIRLGMMDSDVERRLQDLEAKGK